MNDPGKRPDTKQILLTIHRFDSCGSQEFAGMTSLRGNQSIAKITIKKTRITATAIVMVNPIFFAALSIWD